MRRCIHRPVWQVSIKAPKSYGDAISGRSTFVIDERSKGISRAPTVLLGDNAAGEANAPITGS